MPDNYPVNATLLEDDKPKRKLFAWPLWLTLGVGGLFVVLLGVIMGSSFGDTSRGNTVGGVCGSLAAFAFLTGFVQSHFKVRRGGTPKDTWLAKTVLFFGYLVVVALVIGLSQNWNIGDLNVSDTLMMILAVGFIGFICFAVAVGYGWATPPGQLLLHRRLPTVNEYMAKHPSKPGQPIACRNCNSYRINNYGLNGKRDTRRVHFCVSCSSVLYKTDGLIF